MRRASCVGHRAGHPEALFAAGRQLGGIVNLPAIFIIAVVAGLLILGTRESATLNALLVVVKIVALIVFVAVALPYFDAANFEPFMPYGFAKTGRRAAEVGVMAAAAIIFFAFYGFDAIATAAEETKNPGRDLSIGIVGSMVVCVIIYMAVAAAAIGALHFTRFADSPEPLALILREIGQDGVGEVSRRLGGDRAADGDPRLLLRPEPDLLRDGARRTAAAGPRAESPAAARRCGSPSSPRSSSPSSPG